VVIHSVGGGIDMTVTEDSGDAVAGSVMPIHLSITNRNLVRLIKIDSWLPGYPDTTWTCDAGVDGNMALNPGQTAICLTSVVVQPGDQIVGVQVKGKLEGKDVVDPAGDTAFAPLHGSLPPPPKVTPKPVATTGRRSRSRSTSGISRRRGSPPRRWP